jgi:hypothetical protein
MRSLLLFLFLDLVHHFRLGLAKVLLGTKGIPNGRRRDPAGRPGFQLTYENSIFGAPDRWPLVTRLTV